MTKTKAKQGTAGDEVSLCDGYALKNMIGAGMIWLELNHQKVNALNVFPVPDGDTGTNMLLTIRSAHKEVAHLDEANAGKVAEKIYNGALMGARGNSGVILSQLFLGFARGLDGLDAFGANELARSLRVASQTADNVRGMKPVEGTILTVARDGAAAAETALAHGKGIRHVMQQVVEEMFRSVDRTPDLLVKDGEYILKNAGVVDAGGMGLAYIMDGMFRYLNGETIEPSAASIQEVAVSEESSINLSGLDYPYDVQFLLMGDGLDINVITRAIESMGASALVAGDDRLIKVHVHVTNPGVPLGYAAGLGKLTDVVVENMALQYQEFIDQRGTRRAPDSPLTQPPAIAADSIAVVTVAAGDGLTRIFYSLGAGRVIAGGQTMNPSTEEIVQAINSLPTNKILILPNNKNILLAAEQAVQLVNGKRAIVIPTNTIPQGIAALLALDPGGDFDSTVDALKTAARSVETGEITRATRDVTLDNLTVKTGQIIGLHNDDLCVAGDDITDVTLELLRMMGAEKLELITFYYGADVKREEAEALVRRLAAIYPEHDMELQEGAQPHYYYIISAE